MINETVSKKFREFLMFLLSKKCCKCDTDALINIKKPAQKIVETLGFIHSKNRY